MKKYLFFLVATLLCSAAALAQDEISIYSININGDETPNKVSTKRITETTYTPIVQEGRQWVYEFVYYLPDDLEFERHRLPMVFEFKGDTIIDGHECKKLYRTIKGSGVAYAYDNERWEFDSTPLLVACCFEQIVPESLPLGEVHLWATYSDEYCRQMWNYNGATGSNYMEPYDAETKWYRVYEMFRCWALDYEEFGKEMYRNVPLTKLQRDELFTLSKHEVIEINGTERHLHKNEKGYANYIDGIGFFGEGSGMNSGGSFISPIAQFRECMGSTYLNHIVEDGKVVYKTRSFKEELVEKPSSINDVNMETSDNADNAYYNMKGQRVDTPSAGIYIHNGKKIVVK